MQAPRFVVAGPIRIEPLEQEVAVRVASGQYELVRLGPHAYSFMEMLAGRLGTWVPMPHVAQALYRVCEVTNSQRASVSTLTNHAREQILRACPEAEAHFLKQYKLGYMLRS